MCLLRVSVKFNFITTFESQVMLPVNLVSALKPISTETGTSNRSLTSDAPIANPTLPQALKCACGFTLTLSTEDLSWLNCTKI